VRNTTLSDIARKAGVSKSLVSKALSGKPGSRVSPKTRSRIVKIAERLSYRPHSIARKLAHQRTFTIAFCTVSPRYLEGSSFAGAACGILEAVGAHGYTIQFGLTEKPGSEAHGSYFIDLAQEKAVDGFVVFDDLVPGEVVLELREMGYPVVLLKRTFDGIPCVLPDYGSSMIQAVRHLRELGHTDIVFVESVSERKNAFTRSLDASIRKAYAEDSLRRYDILLLPRPPHTGREFEKMAHTLSEFIGSQPAVTAFVVFGGILSCACVKALKGLGYAVPRDYSLVGLELSDVGAQYLEPPLTGTAAPWVEAGKLAGRVVLGMIEGEALAEERHVLPVEFVERESCARPRSSRRRSHRS